MNSSSRDPKSSETSTLLLGGLQRLPSSAASCFSPAFAASAPIRSSAESRSHGSLLEPPRPLRCRAGARRRGNGAGQEHRGKAEPARRTPGRGLGAASPPAKVGGISMWNEMVVDGLVTLSLC